MDLWYNFAKSIVGFYTTLFMKTDIRGQERIPDGPKIIVGNHASITDGFVLPFIIKGKLHFAIMAEVFSLHVIGRLLALADQIPVVKGQGREMLKAARKWLERGDTVVIFPEGRLNFGASLHRSGAGAAMLAMQTGVPVVPLGFYAPPEFIRIVRTRLFDRASVGSWQLGGTLFVNIGKPLRVISEEGQREYHYLRNFTDEIMQSVANLVREIQEGGSKKPDYQNPLLNGH